jgi:hypothetical protein
LNGIRLSFAARPRKSGPSRRTSSGPSLTPSSRTYSNVSRSPVVATKRSHAAKSAARGNRRLIGISRSRSSSVVALSDTASRGRTGSSASRSMAGASPAVESVIRRGAMAKPAGSAKSRTAASTAP